MAPALYGTFQLNDVVGENSYERRPDRLTVASWGIILMPDLGGQTMAHTYSRKREAPSIRTPASANAAPFSLKLATTNYPNFEFRIRHK